MLTFPRLIFATNNLHKLTEAKQILGATLEILSLTDIGFAEEIPEDFNTLAENASQKVWHIYNRFHLNCFADDTGLEVDALEGAPGVYSARYAGKGKTSMDNIEKLLLNLRGITNRRARFRTIIALVLNGSEYRFEGAVEGNIINNLRGAAGFGYDPIFVPQGHSETFAQMRGALKNSISHRGQALEKLKSFLQLKEKK